MNRADPSPRRPDGRAYPAWSIGIYAGPSLQTLTPHPAARNPVLTRHEVTDIPAAFVADPFLVRDGDGWVMFMEVMNAETQRGEIGLARSADGVEWRYEGVVLREPFHLSYPYVFESDGRHFMVPETIEAGAVRLYAADRFPSAWRYVRDLIPGVFADPSVFECDGSWWLLCCGNPDAHDMLNLFSSPTLEARWREHAIHPLIKQDKGRARPAGRVALSEGTPIRFAQDCRPQYGTAVRAFRVTELTLMTYAEIELGLGPILGPGQENWNRLGMHHLDPHRSNEGSWLACVDGRGADNNS
jgi:hypothetical protein